ncbi:MAG: beta-galactosidase [Anaerolineae bacterium]
MSAARWMIAARAFSCVALMAAVMSWLLAAPTPLVRVGHAREVVTRNPKMGVHTRLTDEVEEWKVQRTLTMVREMGAPWIVEYFPWGYMEPEKGRYEWQHADMVVDHALAQGLTVIGRIDFVPDWARPANTTYRYLGEDHFSDLAAFVQAFVARYGERVPYVVIWNEPNLSFEWGYRPPDPASYARLLRVCYRAAKAANPRVQVVLAGLAPATAPEGDPWGMDDLVYLQRLYDAGAGEFFDAVAIHAYGYTFAPDSTPARDVVNFRRAELVHEVMGCNGDGHKPCLITEGGWNDHPRWTRAVSPAQRIQYTLRAYELAQSWEWCKAVALWAFRYPWPAKTYQDGFTFVSPDFTPRPIYGEVRRYALTGAVTPGGDGP